MKRKYLPFLIAIIVTLALLWSVSYCYVDGGELPSMEALTDDYTCSVTKTAVTHNNYDPTTYKLSPEQILALREVLLECRFTRVFSHGYSYKGLHDTYSIVLELENAMGRQVDFIQIFFVEDLYFSVSAPYSDTRLTLKVHSDQLDEKLDQILIGSYPSE